MLEKLSPIQATFVAPTDNVVPLPIRKRPDQYEGTTGSARVLELPVPTAGSPFPEVELSGTPRARGEQHGRALATEVRTNVDFYLDLLADLGLARAQALAHAHRFAAVLAEHVPHLLEEIEGIAAGAGCTVDEILAVNARTELLSLTWRQEQAHQANLGTPGCTSVAVRRGDELALGQNWDWRNEFQERSALFRIHRDDGPDVVTFTEAGMVGKIGCNENQLGVCLNFLRHHDELDGPEVGIPVHIMLRVIMEAESLEVAVARVRSLPRCASANFLIAQHGAGAVDLETTPESVAELPMTGKVLAHANHFVDPSLARHCDRKNEASTRSRYQLANQHGNRFAAITDPVSAIKATLTDRTMPEPISKVADDHAGGLDSGTVASIVMDLSDGYLHITKGPPHKNRYGTVVH